MGDNEVRRQASRQTRGLRRMQVILDTAASVFFEVGYTETTMNMIAGRAGISPGSLYQFFPNKEALAVALATRNIEQLQTHHDQFQPSRLTEMPPSALIEKFIDPLVALNRQHPEYYALFSAAQFSRGLAAVLKEFHEAVVQNIAAMIGTTSPNLSQEERQRAARVMHRIFLAMFPLILEEGDQGQTPILDDMKSIFVSYLSSLADR